MDQECRSRLLPLQGYGPQEHYKFDKGYGSSTRVAERDSRTVPLSSLSKLGLWVV